MGKHKTIRLGGGSENGYAWGLSLPISFNQRRWTGSFTLSDKPRKRKIREKGYGKPIYLTGGSEDGWGWHLKLKVPVKEVNWEGAFDLAIKPSKHKRVYLTGGGIDGLGWQLYLTVSANGNMWVNSFYLADETRKYRSYRRCMDKAWAVRTFPRQWKEHYELHHNWQNLEETCYFLTPKEHREQDRILRYPTP